MDKWGVIFWQMDGLVTDYLTLLPGNTMNEKFVLCFCGEMGGTDFSGKNYLRPMSSSLTLAISALCRSSCPSSAECSLRRIKCALSLS